MPVDQPPSVSIVNGPAQAWINTTPSLTYEGENGKMIFTIHPDGKVDIGNGVPMDEAAQKFWDAVKQMGLRCGQSK
jgi:hypothetical protein